MTLRTELQATLKELRTAGYTLEVKLNAKTTDLQTEALRLHAIICQKEHDLQLALTARQIEMDACLHEQAMLPPVTEDVSELTAQPAADTTTPVIEPKSAKQRFLEACDSAPRPAQEGVDERGQREDERIDSLAEKMYNTFDSMDQTLLDAKRHLEVAEATVSELDTVNEEPSSSEAMKHPTQDETFDAYLLASMVLVVGVFVTALVWFARSFIYVVLKVAQFCKDCVSATLAWWYQRSDLKAALTPHRLTELVRTLSAV